MLAVNRAMHETVDYLVRFGILSTSTIVHEGCTVVDHSRRNTNFQISVLSEPKYFVKIADPMVNSSVSTLDREAELYCWIQSEARASILARYVPPLVRYDRSECTLILRYVPHTQTLFEVCFESSDLESSQQQGAICSHLGTALGQMHEHFRWLSRKTVPSFLNARPPWILGLLEPGPDILRQVSPAQLTTIRVIQNNNDIAEKFTALRKEWSSETLLHGDLRSGNILVSVSAADKATLIDWEAVGVGPAAWDIASLFTDYIWMWLLMVHYTDGDQAADESRTGEPSLSDIQSQLRQIWFSYRQTRGFSAEQGNAFQQAVVGWMVARLAEYAYEAGANDPEPTEPSVLCLQLAANMADEARNASLTILGIPSSPSGPSP